MNSFVLSSEAIVVLVTCQHQCFYIMLRVLPPLLPTPEQHPNSFHIASNPKSLIIISHYYYYYYYYYYSSQENFMFLDRMYKKLSRRSPCGTHGFSQG